MKITKEHIEMTNTEIVKAIAAERDNWLEISKNGDTKELREYAEKKHSHLSAAVSSLVAAKFSPVYNEAV